MHTESETTKQLIERADLLMTAPGTVTLKMADYLKIVQSVHRGIALSRGFDEITAITSLLLTDVLFNPDIPQKDIQGLLDKLVQVRKKAKYMDVDYDPEAKKLTLKIKYNGKETEEA